MIFSLVVPIYKNEANISGLIDAVTSMNEALSGRLEVVFVVDGSPDHSLALLRTALDKLTFPAQVIAHSRNFGSFPAIRSGLTTARGNYYAVMAADLQEPPELALRFFESLSKDECDVAVGTRVGRADPFLSRCSSNVFWRLYRHFVVSEMPSGGVDIFGCNRMFVTSYYSLMKLAPP